MSLTQIKTRTSLRGFPYIVALLMLLALALQVIAMPSAEARTNLYCVGNYYNGTHVGCGQNLQPACNSGPACDAGYIEWSGTGFPQTINCPNINHTKCVPNPIPFLPPLCTTVTENIPNVTLNSGCYDDQPTCDACGGSGQPPCPETGLSCENCDDGNLLDPITGLCLSPSTIGAICDVDVGCAEGLFCDPDASQCFSEAQSGESCVILPCADGLTCAGIECANAAGGELGQACTSSDPCGTGLFCKFGIPTSRCDVQSRPGETCNAFLSNTCVEGSFCFLNPAGPSKCMIDPFGPEITAAQCETFYSQRVANPQEPAPFGNPIVDDRTRTMGGGKGQIVFLEAESKQHGVAYGQFGEYGCFNSVCEGIELDVAVDAFVSTGTYNLYDDVGGESTGIAISGDLPGGFITASETTVFNTNNQVVGQEFALGIGIGIGLPIPAGLYNCQTELITLYGDNGVNVVPIPPLPGPAESADIGFGAMQFNGINDQLAVSDQIMQSLLQVDDEVTLEFWVRANEAQQTAVLLESPGVFQIALDNGDITFRVDTTAPDWNTVQQSGSSVLNEQLWTHLALVYSANETMPQIKLYVNGSLNFSVAAEGLISDAQPANDILTLGNNSSGISPFAGSLRQVRLWSVARTPDELLQSIAQPVDAQSSGLLANWKLSDASGDVLIDSGPLGIDLPFNGNGNQPQRTTSGHEALAGALFFDGVDDHVSVENSDSLDKLVMSNALTIEAWVHPTGPGAHPTFGGVIAGKEGEYYIARNANGQLFYALATVSPGWTSITTSVMLEANRWTHVALTYSPEDAMVHVYVNGELADSNVTTGSIGDAHPERPQFRIGGRQNDDITSSQPLAFNGLIDEVRVWRRAREPFEIAATYTETLDSSAEPELAAWWRFDEAAKSLALDSSGSGVHAQLGLSKTWRYPKRMDAGAYTSYPRSLMRGACSGGECAVDFDNDLISDYLDNCLVHSNASQIDVDGDGYGNACDADFNNDDAANFLDFVTLQNSFLSNDALTDLNSDGVVNFLDLVIFQQLFLQPPGPSANRP